MCADPFTYLSSSSETGFVCSCGGAGPGPGVRWRRRGQSLVSDGGRRFPAASDRERREFVASSDYGHHGRRKTRRV